MNSPSELLAEAKAQREALAATIAELAGLGITVPAQIATITALDKEIMRLAHVP